MHEYPNNLFQENPSFDINMCNTPNTKCTCPTHKFDREKYELNKGNHGTIGHRRRISKF